MFACAPVLCCSDAGSASNPTASEGGGSDDASGSLGASSDATAPDGVGSETSTDSGVAVDARAPDGSPDAGSPPPAYCATNPWMGLETCGWPGPKNTGYDLSQCPGGQLTPMGSSALPMPVIEINKDGTIIRCMSIAGELHITAKNVTVENSYVSYNSGKLGTAANGTAPIVVDDGASATIDHVEINGLDGVHACIWHQGTSMAAHYVNCYGVDDGIFSWADTGYSQTTGDNFTIDNSYFHDFTTATSNGHEDGYQTEGAANGVIQHNTYQMTTAADSAVAIWDSLKDSSNITVEDNLLEGGGASVYADDYNPSETSPQGGFSVTNVVFKNNTFSTHVAPCVGQYFIWYSRPAEPYGGGPTDGWHRMGNVVLETGENVDNGNPHANGHLCT
jgi:hypothetical protein